MNTQIETFESSAEMPRDFRLMAIGYLRANLNFTQCAKEFGVSDRTISNLYNRYIQTGSVDDYERTGRPPKVTEETKEKAIAEIKKKYESTRSVGIKLNLSHTTIENIPHSEELHFAVPEEIPLINQENKKKRFEFCNFDPLDYWIFSDECGFQLFRNTLGIWTNKKKIYVQKTNPFRTLMVWGAISKLGKSPLFIIDYGENEDQILYKKILENNLLPWARSIFPGNFYAFYHDNAPPHKAKSIIDWMQSQIPYIPPYSPDLNPIELIWAHLKKEPSDKNELEEAIKTSWMEIDQELINSCIDHCHKRIREVYENHGKFI